MTKLTIFAAIALVLATAVYLYSDAIHQADEERARADTLERIQNADTGTGDADSDRAWAQ